jgi:hypothetical protein
VASAKLLFCPLLSFEFETQSVYQQKKKTQSVPPNIRAVADILTIVLSYIYAVAHMRAVALQY